MAGFPRPWYLSGGWALDLFLGRVTREHHDLDLILYREDQEALRGYLAGWEFVKFRWRPGGKLEMAWWQPGEWLDPPLVELYVQREGHDPVAFEVFLQEAEGDEWWFHKSGAIVRPRSRIG